MFSRLRRVESVGLVAPAAGRMLRLGVSVTISRALNGDTGDRHAWWDVEHRCAGHCVKTQNVHLTLHCKTACPLSMLSIPMSMCLQTCRSPTEMVWPASKHQEKCKSNATLEILYITLFSRRLLISIYVRPLPPRFILILVVLLMPCLQTLLECIELFRPC
jgi:hypothetical protein